MGLIGGLFELSASGPTSDAADEELEVMAIEEVCRWLAKDALPTRSEHRRQEVNKLRDFGYFVPVLRAQVPRAASLFNHLWVDTPNKSRLTCQDLKRYKSQHEITHWPTPSATSCAMATGIETRSDSLTPELMRIRTIGIVNSSTKPAPKMVLEDSTKAAFTCGARIRCRKIVQITAIRMMPPGR